MSPSVSPRPEFELVWKAVSLQTKEEVYRLWSDVNVLFDPEQARQRGEQLVFVVRDSKGEVVAESTAFKVPVRQLRNWFYGMRLMVSGHDAPPGLLPELARRTVEFLEGLPRVDEREHCIGVITLVENERLKRSHTKAVWPASGMVYIGNSAKGHHLRAHYFKDEVINGPSSMLVS
ncbi:MAG: hypothetical protein JST14_12545 [Bacteroidetes bacterium]|nr:hypothetical protein [Bacteroidota bacterium]